MNCRCPAASSLPNRRICPFRIMCIASYPSIVRHAPSTDRKPRLVVMRFLMKRCRSRCEETDAALRDTALTRHAETSAQLSTVLPVAGRSWLSRYQEGEHEQVWGEMAAL